MTEYLKMSKNGYALKRFWGMLFSLLLLWGIPASAAEGEQAASADTSSRPRIAKVEILCKDVFDPEIQEDNKKLFLLANGFHFRTREWVIRQELLFREGDVYDQKLLAESERNLRNLGFLGRVSILERRNDDGGVEVSVKTQDQWSTVVAFSGHMVGKHYSAGTYFEEHNLLGWGKSLVVGYTKTTEKETGQLSFLDRNLLGKRLVLNPNVYLGSDGHLYDMTFGLPFYSLETEYSFGSRYLNEDERIDYYQEGKEVFSYRKENDKFHAELGKSFGAGWKRLLHVFYQWEDRQHSLASGDDSASYARLLPPSSNLQHLGLSLELWHPRFEKLCYVDNFGNIEDFDFGFRVQGRWGFNLDRLFSKQRTDVFSFRLVVPFYLSPKRYLFFAQSTKGEFENVKWERLSSRTEARFYWGLPGPQTLVLRAMGILSSRQEKGYQLFLDGVTGLRGFEQYRFSGRNEVVFNFEDRIFSPWRILTVGLGGVVFFDGGYVWDETPVGQRFHSDVGLGLRFGFTKSHRWKVSRLDLAKSLETNNWVVSLGTGMYFELEDL
jgi:hypothetical protein